MSAIDLKMTGGTMEVRSDESLTLLTFDIEPMDQYTNIPMDQLTNGPIDHEPMDQWTNGPMPAYSFTEVVGGNL